MSFFLIVLLLSSNSYALKIEKGLYLVGEPAKIAEYQAQKREGERLFQTLPKSRREALKQHGITSLTKGFKKKRIKKESFETICIQKNGLVSLQKKKCKVKKLKELKTFQKFQLTCQAGRYKQSQKRVDEHSLDIFIEALDSKEETMIKRLLWSQKKCP